MDELILTTSKLIIIVILISAFALLTLIGSNLLWRNRINALGWKAFNEAVTYWKKHQPERWEKYRKSLEMDEE